MERRDLLKLLATVPIGAWVLSPSELARAAEHTDALMAGMHSDPHDTQQQPGQQPKRAKPMSPNYKPLFFTALEWRTVKVLADIVIPRDATSGSAGDAGVPQFMDFVMTEYTGNQTRMRDGLGWLNAASRAQFGVPFPDAKSADRLALVESIAWPAKAKPADQPGVRFFSAFRDLTASGFYTSRIGVKDIGYRGNVPQASWTGCPAAAEAHIKVS